MNYEKPIIIDEFDSFEGVFATSGEMVQPGLSGWVQWEGHNTGSHSEVQIFVQSTAQPGEYFKVIVTFCGRGCIASCNPPSGNYTSWAINGNQIIIEKNGHYNPNETFAYMLPDIRFTESQYDQGVGSYYPSGVNMHVPAPEFAIQVIGG